MAFKKVFENDEFTLFFVGTGGTFEGRGGHLYQIETKAIATQGNALVVELPKNAAKEAPGGFEINFDITSPVYQSESAIFKQGDGDGDAIETHYSDSDARRLELNRVADGRGFWINPKTGALWHEARIYALDKSRRVLFFRVVGYVPLTAITRLEIGQFELIEHNPRATE